MSKLSVDEKIPPQSYQEDSSSYQCKAEPVIKLISKKNLLTILKLIDEKPKIRFNMIQKTLNLSPTTVSNGLDLLVEKNLILRQTYSEIPIRVEYETSEKGTLLSHEIGNFYSKLKIFNLE